MSASPEMFPFSFEAFFLVFARLIAFISAAPVFSRRGIPNSVKIALALFLSIIVTGLSPKADVDTSASMWLFSMMLVAETILGLALGYMSNLIFAIVGMGGQLIDFQMGLSIGSVYDPSTQTQSTLFGTLYNWIALMLLLSINGHHYMLYAIVESFRVLPAGEVDLTNYDATFVVQQFTGSLKIAFQISMPVLIILILTDIIMGIIARTVPQLQIFILAIPIKIILGILFIIAMGELTFSRAIPIMQQIPATIERTLGSFM